MTRKDYVAIAEALRQAQPLTGTVVRDSYAAEREVWESCMMEIANVFAADNARFDVTRFFKACQGVK